MEKIPSKKTSDSIASQYDRGTTATEYAESSLENAEKDPGRLFLRESLSMLPRDTAIIDVGCGSGLDLAQYQKMGFTDLYGIDPSVSFIEADKKILNGVDLQQGTFEHVPYPAASFNAVVSRFALHYSRDIQASLREVARVLKPGGSFSAVISHPEADALERRDAAGNVTITLFDGKVSITYPQHVLDEYFTGTFNEYFVLEKQMEYCGKEQDRGKRNDLNNTLCFLARRK